MRFLSIPMPEGIYTESEIRMFIGWLSGDIPQLHAVEVPLLAESWEKYKKKFGLVPDTEGVKT